MLITAPGSTLDATRSTGGWATPVASRRVFLALLFLTCAIHAVTLTRSPPAWQDEIQDIDYGRVLSPGSDQSYGVTWSAEDRPVQLLCYIGCLIQETAYRAAEGAMAGPRISTLIGAVVAAVALRSWLLAAGISPWITLVAACGFLWDPLVVAGYRGARVDVWCMAFMLWALWCIRRSYQSQRRIPLLIVAGTLITVSGLTWVSAILLLPLVLFELHVSASVSRTMFGKRIHQLFPVGFVGSTLVVGLSAAAAMLLLLLPYHGIIGTMLADLRSGVDRTVPHEQNELLAHVWAIPRLFLMSPWLPLIAFVGIAIHGPRSWFLPLTVSVCAVATTHAYGHRAVYLVPYFVYGFAIAADKVNRSSRSRTPFRNAATWLAVVVLIWAGSISLVSRTLNTLNDWARRDPAMVDRFINGLAGESNTRVLLDSWSLYYPIRSRGWRYWGPLDLRATSDVALSLHYDYVIHDESAGLHPLDGALRAAGYNRRVVSVYHGQSSGWRVLSNKTPGYGPYVVYTHPHLTAVDNEPE